MKWLDLVLQRWRINRCKPFLKPGWRVLDVGCGPHGALFEALPYITGMGLDPTLPAPYSTPQYTLLPGSLSQWPLPPEVESFDAITILAVIEHIPQVEHAQLVSHCWQLLKPGGRVILTVPSPQVDTILAGLKTLGLIEGLALGEHYGFDPKAITPLFDRPQDHGGRFLPKIHQRFQLGLNHLMVFEKPSHPATYGQASQQTSSPTTSRSS